MLMLVELDAVFLSYPLLDEALRIRVDLESLLDGFLQTIAAQQRIAAQNLVCLGLKLFVFLEPIGGGVIYARHLLRCTAIDP